MSKATLSFLVSLTIVFTAFANGPVTEALEDVGYGSCDPILANWVTDVVTWNSMAANTTNAFRCASGVIGDWVYMFGEQYGAANIAYNYVTDTWANATPVPLGYCNWPGVVADGSLYIIARYESGVSPYYHDEVQRFTPTPGSEPLGTWVTSPVLAPYPVAMCGNAIAYDGGDLIYSAGGGGTGGVGGTSAYVYSISGNTWTALPNLPLAMKYHGGAYCGGEFHVVGSTSTPTAHYALIGGAWVPRAAPPVGIDFGLFQTCNDPAMTKMYVMGSGAGYGSWPAVNNVQIYDPATDTWVQETPLPVAKGLTSGEMIDADMGFSAGGYPTPATSTFVGTGFVGGVPSFTVTLTYNYGSPVPAGGGAINFDAWLQNNETFPVNFDLWIEIPPQVTPPSVPNRNLTFPAGHIIDRDDMNWPITAAWPAGNYTMDWYIGDMSTWTAWASDSFPFVKSADDDGSGYVLWEVDGDPLDQLFEGIDLGEMVVNEFALLGSYPNPFNPSTTINYTLNSTNRVQLSVYDLSGREVATLVDGYRDAGTHEAQFDASGLASGIYIYRLTSGANVASGKMVLTK